MSKLLKRPDVILALAMLYIIVLYIVWREGRPRGTR